jgi:tRNA-2-methylthio-N6-dimethylallyladenosine synthase
MAIKFFIETFGCQMNDLDSEKIAGNLLNSGMTPVGDPSQADVIILNTCSVRDKAVQKVYTRLGEMKRYASQRKDVVVAVVGCMAQLEGETILKRAPYINILAGPQKGDSISHLIEQSRISRPAVSMRSDENPDPLEHRFILRRNPWRASITISEGCNRNCAFCVVPTTRGQERNRRSADIIKEAEDLAARGYLEILLLGQTVNSYVDRTAENMSFGDLLKRLAAINGIKRIRFTSPHPVDFSDELLEAMIDCPQICNQIHLPVQSGSTRMLKAMRRGYTKESYLRLIKKIQDAPRPIAISTDIIVGFPGETEEDFQDTLSLLDEVQYDSAFSFKYSPRPNTAAFSLLDDVSDKEKRRRLEIVQKRQKAIQYNINAAYLGRRLEVLVEDKARSRVSLTGRTSNNKIVNFDGPESLIGQIVQVEIAGFSPNSLKGVWLDPDVSKKEAEGASIGCPY